MYCSVSHKMPLCPSTDLLLDWPQMQCRVCQGFTSRTGWCHCDVALHRVRLLQNGRDPICDESVSDIFMDGSGSASGTLVAGARRACRRGWSAPQLEEGRRVKPSVCCSPPFEVPKVKCHPGCALRH